MNIDDLSASNKKKRKKFVNFLLVDALLSLFFPNSLQI